MERLNSKLLIWVMVLEEHQDYLIEIPDNPASIPIPAPVGNFLMEIMDETDDDVV